MTVNVNQNPFQFKSLFDVERFDSQIDLKRATTS